MVNVKYVVGKLGWKELISITLSIVNVVAVRMKKVKTSTLKW